MYNDLYPIIFELTKNAAFLVALQIFVVNIATKNIYTV